MKIFYTDGSAEPNPGPGGWAVIDAASKSPVRTGQNPKTTNIRMEGTAIREAIKFAMELGEPVEIHTDSKFWINVLTKWAPTWSANGWHKKNNPIKNLDLVKKLYKLYTTYDVKLVWVKGHAGLELNELADHFAKNR